MTIGHVFFRIFLMHTGIFICPSSSPRQMSSPRQLSSPRQPSSPRQSVFPSLPDAHVHQDPDAHGPAGIRILMPMGMMILMPMGIRFLMPMGIRILMPMGSRIPMPIYLYIYELFKCASKPRLGIFVYTSIARKYDSLSHALVKPTSWPW